MNDDCRAGGLGINELHFPYHSLFLFSTVSIAAEFPCKLESDGLCGKGAAVMFIAGERQ